MNLTVIRIASKIVRVRFQTIIKTILTKTVDINHVHSTYEMLFHNYIFNT